MLDPITLPSINIKPGVYDSIEIKKLGKYIYLKHSGKDWHVFNTHNQRELHEQWSGYDLAYGDVLLSGLGFGHMAQWLANKPEVSSVTVIEILQDVVDIFLESNILNNKVSIIVDDIESISIDKHYDCVIFDHIPNNPKPKEFYKELATTANKIPHNLFWFWSIELFYVMNFYSLSYTDLFEIPVDFNKFDFETKWEDLRTYLDMPTIPSLSKDKIDAYINSYFLRHLFRQQ